MKLKFHNPALIPAGSTLSDRIVMEMKIIEGEITVNAYPFTLIDANDMDLRNTTVFQLRTSEKEKNMVGMLLAQFTGQYENTGSLTKYSFESELSVVRLDSAAEDIARILSPIVEGNFTASAASLADVVDHVSRFVLLQAQDKINHLNSN